MSQMEFARVYRMAAAGRAGRGLSAGDREAAARGAGSTDAVTHAGRTMIPIGESFAAWRKDPKYVEAYKGSGLVAW